MSATDFQKAVAAFLDEMQFSRGKSPRTCEIYDLALKRLAEYSAGLGKETPLDLTGDDLILFSGRWLYDKGVAVNGRRPYIGALRSFFKWCAKTGVAKNIATGLEYPKLASKLPIRMTLTNAEKILHKPDLSQFSGLRDSAMLHIMMGCGIRVSALIGINEGDFIADSISNEPRLLVKVREKGGREQIKLLPREADLAVRMYLESPELAAIDRVIRDGVEKGDKVVFVSVANRNLLPDEYVGELRRLSRHSVSQMMEKYGRRAGVPADQLHPHALRHLFGTEMLESDVDLARAQQLMGHIDPKSTLIYVHLSAVKNAKELDRANPLAKMNTPISQFLAKMKSVS